MLQNVFGIKQFQAQLPVLARQISDVGGHYVVTNRSKPAFVAISFDDYKEIQDILMELGSTKLKKEIMLAREEYNQGKSTDFDQFVLELEK
ncbi:MAG: hypothetical protein A3A82_03925 [Candidatus Pacebacteria bacterium RIFCSPLOWO2_01_FULL_47_12]|nr:MAG: hypothetical protein A3J60_00180 [Candidatus Pacebacteria bacterium RIFCSPHIGHO2_02_FULL_46_9]OGJ39336.1 MAG: hypothetical protein A3A82_03925 [Candidatus Pacebacteria bacterium RIFCSPLOWO2_01_FULL_47_12]